MPCYHPLHGYRSRDVNASGKRSIVFNRSQGFSDLPVSVPCGQCIGCRLERSRQWAMRCVHESQLHEQNCFITLTYNPEHLPADGSLHLEHFQNFMKRLRERFGSGIRFFHCGEYGENFGRPHYHAILFGFDFSDKILFKQNNGVKLYVSQTLNDLWQGQGFCTIGDVTFESCAYVARYVLKKVTGAAAESHYSAVVKDTGEIVLRRPEYVTMSRRGGIGRGWFEKYHEDVFPGDFVVMRGGLKLKPPKFYDRLYESMHSDEFHVIKSHRILDAKESKENTIDRLEIREECKSLRLKLLPRRFENEN